MMKLSAVALLFFTATAVLAAEDTPRDKLTFPQKRGATYDENRFYQSLGRFIVAPDASYFLYEWQHPYNWSPDYKGLGKEVAARKETAIYKVNVSGDKPTSEYLFYPAPGATYYLGNLSPDGKWLSFYELDWDNKSLRAGVVLMDDGISPRIAWMQGRPAPTQLTKPAVWLANDELAFATEKGWMIGKIPDKEPEVPLGQLADHTVKTQPCGAACSPAMLAKAPTVATPTGAAPTQDGLPDKAKELAHAGDLAIYSVDTPEKLALYFKKGESVQTLFENDRRPQAAIEAEEKKLAKVARATKD